MNSETYSDTNLADQMSHYAYPNTETQPFEFNNALRQSPTTVMDQYHPTHTLTANHGNRANRNGTRGADALAPNGNHIGETVRMGTRSRTGARVSHSTHASLSSPDEKESREVEKEPVTKTRTKRARTERREALIVDSDSTPMSLVCRRHSKLRFSMLILVQASNFAKLDLGALKKYKQYHQMRLDTSANKSEIIEGMWNSLRT
jgi:hypothetical protein